jgi:hypothetical protein
MRWVEASRVSARVNTRFAGTTHAVRIPENVERLRSSATQNPRPSARGHAMAL